MDANGARELQKRLEAHEQWRQAEAVLDGRLPPTDPDLPELAEIGDGVRYYGCEQRETTVDGRRALVTFRMTKTLVDGCWERSLIQESVEFLDTPPATGQVLPGPA